jgi:hypothetical protein
MDRNKLPFEPRHLVVPSGVSKMISKPMVHLVQSVHLSCIQNDFRANCIKISIISNRTETIFHLSPSHLGVPSSACKTISEAMVRLAQAMDLSCTDTNTISNRQKWDSTWLTSPSSSMRCTQNDFWANGTFGANRASILNQDWHYLHMDRNELLFEPCHLGVPSGASKMNYEPVVRLVETVHLSCTETNIVSKRTETRFYMTQVT